MPSVYVETSIPSYYFERRPTVKARLWRETTREWWDNHRRAYSLFTSTFVLAELRNAPSSKGASAVNLLSGIQLLPELAGLNEVIAYYIEHRLMPADALGDAAHLAMASMHRMDFLLTWNINHLANANKIQHLSVLNARLGLAVPIVTTPFTLLPEVTP